MKKLKIIQTPARFYPAIGGVEKYVYDLSRELVKQGNNVKVICANEPNSNIKNFEGIKIERLSYHGKIANTNLTFGLPFTLLKEEFDLIHTHMPTPWSSDISSLVCFIKNKPLILTYHNDLIKKGFSKVIAEAYNRTLLKVLLKRAKKIIITQPDYLDFSKYLKKYKNKIVVIPNAIDINKFRNKKIKREEESLFFLSVLDEFHRYKGIEYLLEAIALIKKEIPRIRLYVGGKGILLNEYQNLAKKLEIEKNIVFLGYIPDNEIVKEYNKAACFVLPSINYNEGFGIVLLEAMVCKTPVIGTDIVGIAKEIRKNNCGIVVKPKDSKELAEAIIKILKNPKLAKKMGENGRELVEKEYNWVKVAREVEKIYGEVLRK